MAWIEFPLGYFDSTTGWVSLYACVYIHVVFYIQYWFCYGQRERCMLCTFCLVESEFFSRSAPLITYSLWFYETVPLHVCVTFMCPRSDKSLLESPLLHTLLSVLGEPANLSSWWENPPNTCYQTVGLVHQLCLVMVDRLPSLLEKTNSPGESG